MNKIENKEMAVDAAKLFREEVLNVMPDIPRTILCDMVDDYIYYQTDELSKEESRAIIAATCNVKRSRGTEEQTRGRGEKY